MDKSYHDIVKQQIQEVLEVWNLARTRRREKWQHAVDARNLKLATSLVAHEIAAEKRLEQVMNKFGDQADTWYSQARRDDNPATAFYSQVQLYAEAELECREELQKSESKSARLKLLELEASLASNSELQSLFEKWSSYVERAARVGNLDYQKFAEDSVLICERALAALERK